MIYWFIGQPGCGKTTLAKKLKSHLDKVQVPAIHLDGDDLRVIFGGTYHKEHFTKEYRDTNTRKLQQFVKYIDMQGVSVIVSTVNSDRAVREEFKSAYQNLIEIYVVNSGTHIRENFKRHEFEEPLEKYLTVDTNGRSEDDSFKFVLDKILKFYEY